MIKLSDRLQMIADFITQGETMADIGTDHGFLPIYLWQSGICPNVILSDINKGPIEKAKENINANCPGNIIDIRFGSGIETLAAAEVDDVVIAGMGGFLILDILSADLEKSKTYKKFILQPRNAPEKMKQWLLENGFVIADESLVRESRYIWEIILAIPLNQLETSLKHNYTNFILGKDKILDLLDLEINPILFQKKDPLLVEFINNKIRIEEKIISNMGSVNAIKNKEKLESTKNRICKLKAALDQAIRNA